MDPLSHENGSPSETYTILARIPATLKERLRAAGLKTGQNMSGIIRVAVEQYLDDHGHADTLPKPAPAWKRVLDVLCEHAKPRTTQGHPKVVVNLPIQKVANVAKMTPSTVKKAYKILEERGDIWREPPQGWGRPAHHRAQERGVRSAGGGRLGIRCPCRDRTSGI